MWSKIVGLNLCDVSCAANGKPNFAASAVWRGQRLAAVQMCLACMPGFTESPSIMRVRLRQGLYLTR